MAYRHYIYIFLNRRYIKGLTWGNVKCPPPLLAENSFQPGGKSFQSFNHTLTLPPCLHIHHWYWSELNFIQKSRKQNGHYLSSVLLLDDVCTNIDDVTLKWCFSMTSSMSLRALLPDRGSYDSCIYVVRPNMYQFVRLMQSNCYSELLRLCKFIFNAFRLRKSFFNEEVSN